MNRFKYLSIIYNIDLTFFQSEWSDDSDLSSPAVLSVVSIYKRGQDVQRNSERSRTQS